MAAWLEPKTSAKLLAGIAITFFNQLPNMYFIRKKHAAIICTTILK